MTALKIDDAAADLLFRTARTQNGWLAGDVSDAQLRAIYDLMKWGPTSANCSPMRLVFLRSPAAKERLKPALSSGNLAKTMSAPVVAIVAMDLRFFELLPRLFPHEPSARSWFEGPGAEPTAFRNSSLQGAYFMIAARAVGLDCGPMSGFNADKVNKEFFPDGRFAVNFLCNLGHGDPSKVMGRSPRLDFEDVAQIL
jgi:3-hydroxypropanoate dehydrogenase